MAFSLTDSRSREGGGLKRQRGEVPQKRFLEPLFSPLSFFTMHALPILFIDKTGAVNEKMAGEVITFVK